MTTKPQSLFSEQIKNNAGLAIWLGIIVLIVGFLATASPFITGLSVAILVGAMLVAGGIAQLIFSIRTGNGVFAILMSILAAVAGGYMLMNPALALETLTLFIAAYLMVSGILETLTAFQIKPVQGWGWVLFSGIMTVVLGVMIWAQFPVSGAWAIGILVGINLIFSGWSLIMMGIAVRSLMKTG